MKLVKQITYTISPPQEYDKETIYQTMWYANDNLSSPFVVVGALNKLSFKGFNALKTVKVKMIGKGVMG